MKITKVKSGELIEIDGYRDQLVKTSCGTNTGRWYCVTCNEDFFNQLQKDSHIDDGLQGNDPTPRASRRRSDS